MELKFEGEGEALSVMHYNTQLTSMLVVATQRWRVHGCDLRTQKEAWCLKVPPTLGFLTTAAMCPGERDRCGAFLAICVCTCAGTV